AGAPRVGASSDEHAEGRAIGWIVTGVGAGSLITSGITFAIRGGAMSDLDDKCPSHQNCPDSLKDTVDKGKTMSTLSSVFFPVGVVGLGAGLALVFTSGGSKSEAPAKSGALVRVKVQPSLGGDGVSGAF